MKTESTLINYHKILWEIICQLKEKENLIIELEKIKPSKKIKVLKNEKPRIKNHVRTALNALKDEGFIELNPLEISGKNPHPNRNTRFHVSLKFFPIQGSVVNIFVDDIETDPLKSSTYSTKKIWSGCYVTKKRGLEAANHLFYLTNQNPNSFPLHPRLSDGISPGDILEIQDISSKIIQCYICTVSGWKIKPGKVCLHFPNSTYKQEKNEMKKQETLLSWFLSTISPSTHLNLHPNLF